MRSMVAAILVLVPFLLFGQESASSWKEYVYPNDGFAITLPSAPNPHRDLTMPNMTAYTVHLAGNISVTLRVASEMRDCASTLALLKEGALHGKQPGQPIDPSSVRDFSANGYPGVEYEFNVNPKLKTYDRYYCVKGRFYIFTADWPSNAPKPPAVARIIESFRLTKPAALN